MTPPVRSAQQRKADTLRPPRARRRHVGGHGRPGQPGLPYLVPLSFLWDGATVLISTPAGSPTSRNLRATGRVRPGHRPHP